MAKADHALTPQRTLFSGTSTSSPCTSTHHVTTGPAGSSRDTSNNQPAPHRSPSNSRHALHCLAPNAAGADDSRVRGEGEGPPARPADPEGAGTGKLGGPAGRWAAGPRCRAALKRRATTAGTDLQGFPEGPAVQGGCCLKCKTALFLNAGNSFQFFFRNLMQAKQNIHAGQHGSQGAS